MATIFHDADGSKVVGKTLAQKRTDEKNGNGKDDGHVVKKKNLFIHSHHHLRIEYSTHCNPK